MAKTHPRADDPDPMLAAIGIDRDRIGPVLTDLQLVDRLEDRLDELTFPHPDAAHTAADAVRQLIVYARATIIHWHRQLPPPDRSTDAPSS